MNEVPNVARLSSAPPFIVPRSSFIAHFPMPFLSYDIDAAPHAGRLTRRALVGRRLSHGVVLTDPGVSRLHAWFDPAPGGGWAVTDAGSKTGLSVNGARADRHDLRDGDVVRVGSTRITFHADGEPPPAAEPVTLSPPPGQPVQTSGILFTCQCGAPIWVGNDLAGKRGRCRHCKRPVIVPLPGVAAPAFAAPDAEPAVPGRRSQCGVCHSAIGVAEPLTTCPECDTTYHAECWAENYGCSTYGCGQVDALNPNAAAKPPAVTPDPAAAAPHTVTPPRTDPYDDDDDDEAAAPPVQPWVVVLAAVVASAIGLVTFGVAPAAVAVWAGFTIARRRPGTRVAWLLAALALGLIGILVGLAGSDYLFLAGRHLPWTPPAPVPPRAGV